MNLSCSGAKTPSRDRQKSWNLHLKNIVKNVYGLSDYLSYFLTFFYKKGPNVFM